MIHLPKKPKIQLPESIPASSDAIQHLLRFGTYIFDNPQDNIASGIDLQAEYAIPAGFVVNGREEQWVFVYELTDDWIREEVEFCFNTVGVALNYRLFFEGIKEDLQQAANIQQSLLPEKAPEIPGFQIAFRSLAAEFVVGDLYDFFRFDVNYFGVCIGDASGHGMPAALLVRDIVTGLRMGLEKEMKIIHTIKKLNRVIHRSNYSTRYVSLFYCEIDANGDLVYVNAGHPPPLLVGDGGTQEFGATGITIGFVPEIKFHHVWQRMKPGEILVLYTDGIFEMNNSAGEMFGIPRLKDTIFKNRAKTPEEIVDAVFKALDKFSGRRSKWKDDATLVIIKNENSLPN